MPDLERRKLFQKRRRFCDVSRTSRGPVLFGEGPLAAIAGLGIGSDTAEAYEIARRLAEVSGP